MLYCSAGANESKSPSPCDALPDQSGSACSQQCRPANLPRPHLLADEDDDGDGVSDVDDYDSLNPLVWEEPGFSITFGQYFTTILAVMFLVVFLTREKDEDEPQA